MRIKEASMQMPGNHGGVGACSRVVEVPDGAEIPPDAVETAEPVRPWSFDQPDAPKSTKPPKSK